MSTLDIVLGVAGGAGSLSGLGSYLLLQRNTSRAALVDQEQLRAMAQSTHDLALDLKLRLERNTDDLARLREEVHGNQQKISVLESKMDVFWRNVALDVANVLHSPHPGWHELDFLLERFRDGTITDPEMTQLGELLHEVKDGSFGGPHVSVSRADQVAASLMLRAIEQTRGTGATGSGQI